MHLYKRIVPWHRIKICIWWGHESLLLNYRDSVFYLHWNGLETKTLFESNLKLEDFLNISTYYSEACFA